MLTLNGICWCLLVSFGVWRRLFVSYGVWRCEEGVWGVSKRISECCLWTCLRFGSLCESIWVFRLCMVQQLLNIGKSPEGKIPHTWHFWNLKIQKPPYISFLKIIGLLHFFKFMGPSEENYNQQSLWITLYVTITWEKGWLQMRVASVCTVSIPFPQHWRLVGPDWASIGSLIPLLATLVT